MTDNLKVGLPHTYTVRSSTTKRDHVTESAVNSVPGRGQRRRGGHDAPADRLEFSVDLTEEEDEPAEKAEGTGAEAGAHTRQRPVPDEPGDKKRPSESTPIEDGADYGPGSILDVEA